MMTFKDSLESANDVFFDEEVFADKHQIEYLEVSCVVDNDIHGRDNNHEEGKKEIRIHIADKECQKVGLQPMSEGQSLNVDGTEYIIQSWSHEMGVHVIYAYRYGEQVII